MKKYFRSDIVIILCVKLVLLVLIQQAFFSKQDKVPVDATGLNRHLGLLGGVSEPEREQGT